MFKFIGKAILFFIKLTVAVTVIMVLLSIAHAVSDGTHQAGNVLWRAISAIGHDLWAVGGQFLHQCSENLGTLADGAEHDSSFNPFRWFIGGPVYIFVAACQTIVWWLSHGRAVDGVMYLVGVPLMIFLVFPQLGNIGLGGGGGGGGHSKGGGGGHH